MKYKCLGLKFAVLATDSASLDKMVSCISRISDAMDVMRNFAMVDIAVWRDAGDETKGYWIFRKDFVSANEYLLVPVLNGARTPPGYRKAQEKWRIQDLTDKDRRTLTRIYDGILESASRVIKGLEDIEDQLSKVAVKFKENLDLYNRLELYTNPEATPPVRIDGDTYLFSNMILDESIKTGLYSDMTGSLIQFQGGLNGMLTRLFRNPSRERTLPLVIKASLFGGMITVMAKEISVKVIGNTYWKLDLGSTWNLPLLPSGPTAPGSTVIKDMESIVRDIACGEDREGYVRKADGCGILLLDYWKLTGHIVRRLAETGHRIESEYKDEQDKHFSVDLLKRYMSS